MFAGCCSSALHVECTIFRDSWYTADSQDQLYIYQNRLTQVLLKLLYPLLTSTRRFNQILKIAKMNTQASGECESQSRGSISKNTVMKGLMRNGSMVPLLITREPLLLMYWYVHLDLEWNFFLCFVWLIVLLELLNHKVGIENIRWHKNLTKSQIIIYIVKKFYLTDECEISVLRWLVASNFRQTRVETRRGCH